MASSRLPVLFNNEAMFRVFGTRNIIIINDHDKLEEERLKISCNYKQGDKVRYDWYNEIRTGTVTRIDYSVIIKDSMIGDERALPLKNVIGYNTEK